MNFMCVDFCCKLTFINKFIEHNRINNSYCANKYIDLYLFLNFFSFFFLLIVNNFYLFIYINNYIFILLYTYINILIYTLIFLKK